MLLAGCGEWRSRRDHLLPTQLSLLVEERGGDLLSVVMDLRRNTRNQLDVRVSEGARLFDGRRLWSLASRSDADGYRVHLTDELARGGERDLPFVSTTPPYFLAVDRQHVWMRTSTGTLMCALAEPPCVPTADTPGSPLDHMGPGRGFHVELTPNGDLRLSLPLDPDGSAQTILNDVKRVIGAHWVHEGFLERDAVLDRTFRGRASLVAVPRSITVDGQLTEWGGAEPLVVESPWQLDGGAPAWDGPRDASFSVTAARSPTGVCFGGRVRDDDLGPGDAMTLTVGSASVTLPLVAAGDVPGGVVREDWYGRRFEACVDVALTAAGHLPFFAALNDVDGDAVATVLSSAPAGGLDEAGTLKVSP